MSPTSKRSRSGLLRVIAFLVIATLSLYWPLSLVYWSFAEADAAVPFGKKTLETKVFYSGCIKDGELLFTVVKAKAHTVGYNYQLRRLDLKTGVERKTPIQNVSHHWEPFHLGNELYAVMSFHSIYKITDETLVEIGAFPEHRQRPYSKLFLFDGQLTSVFKTDDNRFRMMHLSDHQWIEGREILLPNPRQAWYDDPQSGRKKLLPATSLQPDSLELQSDNQFQFLSVTQNNGRDVLFMVAFTHPLGHHNFYRTGFEFVDDGNGDISALAPENSTHEVSGWESATDFKPGKLEITGDSIGPLLFRRGNSFGGAALVEVLRRHPDGSLTEIEGLNTTTYNSLIVDSTSGIAYVIEEMHDGWNSVAFRRIDGNVIQPAFLTFQRGASDYLNRWRSLSFGMLAAWLLHFVIMTCATACLARSASRSHYESDLHQATLASLWRRMAALTFDLILVVVVLFGLWKLLTLALKIPWSAADDLRLGNLLFSIEELMYDPQRYPYIPGRNLTPDRFLSMLASLVQPLVDYPVFYFSWFGTALVLFGVRHIVEGRYGVTPGKWLFGIRTVQSSLNPLGVVLAIVRNLTCVFEFLFLVTPIPAVFFMTLSQQHRRLGDYLANTLVIRANTIRDIETNV